MEKVSCIRCGVEGRLDETNSTHKDCGGLFMTEKDRFRYANAERDCGWPGIKHKYLSREELIEKFPRDPKKKD